MDIRPDSVVAVIGTGPIALSAAALAVQKGAQVYVIGRNNKKLQIALKIGVSGIIDIHNGDLTEGLQAQTGGRLANFILECSGREGMLNEIIKIAEPKAVAALIGFYSAAPTDVDFNTLVAKELTFIGIMGEYGNLEAVSKIAAEHDMKLAEMITEERLFSECEAALSAEERSGVVKTMIKISEETVL